MNVSVVWFRRDLRLIDNEAVAAAVGRGRPCVFVFVIDPWFFSQPEIGLLRVRFLFDSLAALDEQLQKQGNRLLVLSGNTVEALSSLLTTVQQEGWQPELFFNYDIQVTYGKERDQAIVEFCRHNSIAVQQTHNYFLLNDKTKMDDWWRQYYNYQYADQLPMPQIPAFDTHIKSATQKLPQYQPHNLAQQLSITLSEPRQQLFTGGEVAAHQAVYGFLKDRVDGYHWKISRPYLAQNGATSLLGPHLAFGTISSRTVFQAAANHMNKVEPIKPKKGFAIATYLDRLRWRDSFTQRLFFHPELMWENRFPEFNELYNWDPLTDQQQEYFDRWKSGTTGFPLLDAAMRQLKVDGFINFRMRAMSATFLSINCQVSWHHGATHFMNCLVDGDIAINHWQWQMQSGITNPLSPVFRMYSPTKNLRERDNNADYVHFWLPETRGQSVDTILQNAQPMLDFSQTRKINGKIVADIRKQVRERILVEKGDELDQASKSHKIVRNYNRYSADRYKRYVKDR